MLVTINGKRWRFLFGSPGPEFEGHCDPPWQAGKKIIVRKLKSRQAMLDLVLHECLHAADFSKDEEWVSTTATDLARILERLFQEGKIPNE